MKGDTLRVIRERGVVHVAEELSEQRTAHIDRRR